MMTETRWTAQPETAIRVASTLFDAGVRCRIETRVLFNIGDEPVRVWVITVPHEIAMDLAGTAGVPGCPWGELPYYDRNVSLPEEA